MRARPLLLALLLTSGCLETTAGVPDGWGAIGADAGQHGATPPPQPDPTVHASGLAQPQSLVVEADAVFWANKGYGTVSRLDLESAEVTVLATGISGPEGRIAVSPTHVYWGEWQDGGVRRAPRGGGPTETVAATAPMVQGVATTASHVYWTHFGGSVARAPLDGGDPEDLAWDLEAGPREPLIVGDLLVVATFDGALRRLDTTAVPGAVWEEIAPPFAPGAGLDALRADPGGELVYASLTHEDVLFRVPLAGGAVEIVAADHVITDLDVDFGHVYWNDLDLGIVRRPVDGGELEYVHGGEPALWAIALGHDRIWWTNHPGVGDPRGDLRSLPKP